MEVEQVFLPHVEEDQEFIEVEDPGVRQSLRRLDGRRLLASWSPPRVRLLKTSEQKPLRYSDLPSYAASDALVLRRTGLDALGPFLDADGEFLPLACDQADLWLYNCTRVVDALDEEHSGLTRFPSTGRIMRIDRYAFRPERLTDLRAFKIPQLPFSALFVSGAVVKAAREANLVRAPFRLVWSASRN
jgi:hypothetical protein